MGKGSSPRPYSVTQEEFGNRYDAIFGSKKPSAESQDQQPAAELISSTEQESKPE